jgi:hypothetical protein
MVDTKSTYRLRDRVVLRVIADDPPMLMHIDKAEWVVFGGPTAGLLLKRLDGSRTLQSILDEFASQNASLRNKLINTLERLFDLGFVESVGLEND